MLFRQKQTWNCWNCLHRFMAWFCLLELYLFSGRIEPPGDLEPWGTRFRHFTPFDGLRGELPPSHVHSTQSASLCHSWGTIGQAHIPTKKTSQNSWKQYEICVALKHDNNLTKHMGVERSCLEQPLEVDKNFTQILVKSRWLVHIPNHVG